MGLQLLSVPANFQSKQLINIEFEGEWSGQILIKFIDTKLN